MAIHHLVFVAVGGAVGAVLRYQITALMTSVFGRSFPYGTLTVNVGGSFLMGLFMALLLNDRLPEHPWRPLITVGLFGALTTFSTFSLDNLLMLQQGQLAKAALNILLNVTLSLAAVWLGYQLVPSSNS